MSKIKDEFRRMALRLLNSVQGDEVGVHRVTIDDMELNLQGKVEQLFVWVKKVGGGIIIWNDAAGGCTFEERYLVPYCDELRRRLVLDELADV